MLSCVEQHVTDRVSRLSRRAQRADVVAAKEYGSTAPKDALYAARNAGRDGLHRSAERVLVARLEDQMEMIALHGEVDDARAVVRVRLAQRVLENAHERARSQ